MKCLFCSFESITLDRDAAVAEMERHIAVLHPVVTVPLQACLALLDFHLRYKTPPGELVSKFFEIRNSLSSGYLQDVIDYPREDER